MKSCELEGFCRWNDRFCLTQAGESDRFSDLKRLWFSGQITTRRFTLLYMMYFAYLLSFVVPLIALVVCRCYQQELLSYTSQERAVLLTLVGFAVAAVLRRLMIKCFIDRRLGGIVASVKANQAKRDGQSALTWPEMERDFRAALDRRMWLVLAICFLPILFLLTWSCLGHGEVACWIAYGYAYAMLIEALLWSRVAQWKRIDQMRAMSPA